MKVRELIDELKLCDMDQEIVIGLGRFGAPSSYSNIAYVHQYHDGPDRFYIIPMDRLDIDD